MTQNYPYSLFRFNVEIDGINVASFSEISGLGAELEFDDFQEGGMNDFSYKLLKSVKYNNLILKHGMTDSTDLFDWFKKTVEGKVEVHNVGVTLIDEENNDVRRWDFKNAYPVKWLISDPNAMSSALMIETFELAHQGMIF